MPQIIEGFSWAVIEAFKRALAQCRFEEGDYLFDKVEAYTGRWSESRDKINHAVMVLSPKRGGFAEISEDIKESASVFVRNWKSEVIIELIDYNNDTRKIVKSTQGRLYTLLWKGDLSVLEDREIKCTPPNIASRFLLEYKNIISMTVLYKCNIFREIISRNRNPCVFIMPCDVANYKQCIKCDAVQHALKCRLSAIYKSITLDEIGLDIDRYVPTLRLAIYIMDNPEMAALNEELKSVLYKPTKTTAEKPRGFTILRHGIIIKA